MIKAWILVVAVLTGGHKTDVAVSTYETKEQCSAAFMEWRKKTEEVFPVGTRLASVCLSTGFDRPAPKLPTKTSKDDGDTI